MQASKRKVLACLMSLVMVFSMTSAAALTAFADQLAAGTLATQSGGNGIVWDEVYGVIGTDSGDYALMMKTVTYEAQYNNIPNYQYRATVTDLARSDGKVTIHSNSARADHQGILKDKLGEEAVADYGMGATWASVSSGYVRVANKSTGKIGLKKVDGTELVPCTYDSLIGVADGDLLAFKLEGDMVNVSFMDPTGASLGSFSFKAASETEEHAAFTMLTDVYIQINMRIDGQFYQAYAKKVGSRYEQATDVTGMYSLGDTTQVVVAKTDGYMYYCAAGKDEVKLGPNEGFDRSWQNGSLISLVRSSDDYEVKYTADGTKITVSDKDVLVWLNKSYVGYWEIGDPIYDEDFQSGFAVYDYSGNEIKRFDSGYTAGLGDWTHFATMTDMVYDDNGELVEGELFIRDSNGNIVKDLGKVVDWESPIAVGTYENGKRVIVGYELAAEGSPTGKAIYYDTDFNVVDSLPNVVNGSNITENSYQLADGTKVLATTTSILDEQTWQYTHTTSVADSAGNPIVLGGKTLAIGTDTGVFVHYNTVKHGNADVWWAKDSSGKFGAVDSAGNTVIDFKYEAAYDAGAPNTDYALVREDGVWKFIKVAGEGAGTTTEIGAVEPEPEPGPDPEPEPEPGPDPDNPGVDYVKADRLKGNIALDTMSAIVDKGNFDKNGTVVLTTAEGYWDALTAAGIAGLAKAPVLMTNDKELSSQTRAQLKKLNPKTIVICGGTAALPTKIEEAAQQAVGAGTQIKRAYGNTATGTAVDIFSKAPGITGGKWADTAFVCTNDGYWDALAAAPISYAKNMPIFLTEGAGDISDETLNAMVEGGVKDVYIVGGRFAINDSVKKKIEGKGIRVVDRLWGNTAIETSEAVASFGLSLNMTADNVGVATNNGYWDALAGAALCGKLGSVLVLVENESSHSITSFLSAHKAEIADVNIFGGPAAVSDATEAAVLAVAK